MAKYPECNTEVLEECAAVYPKHKEKIMRYGRGREELEKEELEKAEQEANGVNDLHTLAMFVSEKFATQLHHIRDAAKMKKGSAEEPAQVVPAKTLDPALQSYLDEKIDAMEKRLLEQITQAIAAAQS
jgi:hypothetical protein